MNSVRCGLIGNLLSKRLFNGNVSISSVRSLYNEQFLGIDKYAEGRQRTIARLGNMKGNFYNRMVQQLNSKAPSMVFTEDLKTVIHTCEDQPEEIDMCIQMMKKFHKQNKELRFGTFIFGPVAMRLFYFLKKHDQMLEFHKDPELSGFFDQLKSYLLSMDLYFENNMYNEVIEAFKDLQEKQIAETKFPREAFVLTAGSCYKLNTPETYQYSIDMVTQAREARVPVLRKALSFVVALALNQNHPDVALELLSSVDRFNNITGNNLKLTSMANLDRLQDAFDILRLVTDQDAPNQVKIRGEICQSTLDAVQKAVDRADDKETSHIFEQLCRSLKESNSVTSQTIDDLVCQPIEPRLFLRDDTFGMRQRGDRSAFGERTAFPESSFRPRDRFDKESDYPVRRRRYAGIGEDY